MRFLQAIGVDLVILLEEVAVNQEGEGAPLDFQVKGALTVSTKGGEEEDLDEVSGGGGVLSKRFFLL